MYECSVCRASVEVDHVNPPVKSCQCDGTVHATMTGALAGAGTLQDASPHHNLSPEGQVLTKSFLTMLAAQEFVHHGKTSVYVREQRVTDTDTGRTIVFDITGRDAQ